MDLADRFGLPVVTLVDTPGAYPRQGRRGTRPVRGDRPIDREMPGAAGAAGQRDHRRGRLGRGRRLCHGEPGGDAGTFDLLGYLARGLTPRSCGRMPKRCARPAEALRLTAQDLLKLGVCDQDHPRTGSAAPIATGPATVRAVGQAIRAMLAELDDLSPPGPARQATAEIASTWATKGLAA